jgi:hypothetical protein
VAAKEGRGAASRVFPMKAMILIILVNMIIAAWILGSSVNVDSLLGINPHPIPACYSGPVRCLR